MLNLHDTHGYPSLCRFIFQFFIPFFKLFSLLYLIHIFLLNVAIRLQTVKIYTNKKKAVFLHAPFQAFAAYLWDIRTRPKARAATIFIWSLPSATIVCQNKCTKKQMSKADKKIISSNSFSPSHGVPPFACARHRRRWRGILLRCGLRERSW